MNCCWCGLPLRYLGSSGAAAKDEASTVHVYECARDGRVYLTESQGFTRRRPAGWVSPPVIVPRTLRPLPRRLQIPIGPECPAWNGTPCKGGNLFSLRRDADGTRDQAVCELWSSVFGWEVRLLVNGDLERSLICRTGAEWLDTGDAWKAALTDTGWTPEAAPQV